MKNVILRRLFKATTAEVKENHLRAVATVYGVPDRGGDVIFPNAISDKVFKNWLSDGWLDSSHSWSNEAIGMPSNYEVDGTTVILENEFHSDEASQNQRIKIAERLAAKKKVSVSIGFMPDYSSVAWFNSGKELLDHAEEKGYNLEDFDTAAIKKLKYCRAIVAIEELFELSVCNVGMHRGAKATEVKQIDFEGDDNHGLPLLQHLQLALGAVRRTDELKELREANGQSVGTEALALLQSLVDEATVILGAPLGKSQDPEEAAPKPDFKSDLQSLEVLALELL